MDKRQFPNECVGCEHDGDGCALWDNGLCHEQNYYAPTNIQQQIQPDSADKTLAG